ncbi:hypothetical protein LJR090_004078 [Bosea sp. LjRoot90]|uniref:hypothetical protein n=1 Tax=Bosea sp. LjRoot90 TaxID=3342342 RepID=UPI003ECCE294
MVEVHLTAKGHELHPKTVCLTDALLRHSGLEIPRMIELNRTVQALRKGICGATDGQQAMPETGGTGASGALAVPRSLAPDCAGCIEKRPGRSEAAFREHHQNGKVWTEQRKLLTYCLPGLHSE